jgi:flagellin FlaB
MLNKFLRREKGITGLETAIILIAFVVVAAVFAYTVLSAGLFATQKSQEAVYSGLTEARSTLELKGAVTAVAGTPGDTGSTIKQISFTVSNVLGGEPIDFTGPTANTSTNTGLATTNSTNKVVINYIDENQKVNDLYWYVTKLGSANANNLLEQGEKFMITVGESTGTAGGNLVNALDPDLTINKTFSLVVVTPNGAILQIERTTPAYIDDVVNLR